MMNGERGHLSSEENLDRNEEVVDITSIFIDIKITLKVEIISDLGADVSDVNEAFCDENFMSIELIHSSGHIILVSVKVWVTII